MFVVVVVVVVVVAFSGVLRRGECPIFMILCRMYRVVTKGIAVRLQLFALLRLQNKAAAGFCSTKPRHDTTDKLRRSQREILVKHLTSAETGRTPIHPPVTRNHNEILFRGQNGGDVAAETTNAHIAQPISVRWIGNDKYMN